ncbi:MAG: hypothetical protein GC155_00010 [Alphaproteobacteria bacterium]|nr:hypothetical protein [Alphaproteobacteria bacterium]
MTGVIGEGEGGQSPHPEAEAFARLLISRGADPFDAQALYNISLGPDSTFWLDLLWSESKKRGETQKWTGSSPKALGGDRIPNALAYLLGNAVPNHPVQAAWLLQHGADANGVNFYSRLPVIKHAMLAGRQDVVDLLLAHGARLPELSQQEQFLAAATADLDALRRLAASNPDCLRDPEPMFAAIRQNRVDIAKLLLDLGMSPNVGDEKNFRALHLTTHCGAEKIAALLIARGAEIDPFEQRYGGTPLTHASYNNRPEMVALLAPVSRNFRGLCFAGAIGRVQELLEEAPDRANREDRPGEPALFCFCDNEERAIELADLLLAFGADPGFRNPLGQTPADAARLRGFDDLAELLDEAAEARRRA